MTWGKLLDGISDLVVKLFLALSGSVQAISGQLSLVIMSLLSSSNVFPSLAFYSRVVRFLDFFLFVGINSFPAHEIKRMRSRPKHRESAL